MPTIVFVDPAGNETAVDCPSGDTLMHAAVGRAVVGILGECGGNCACATCHVFLDPAWTATVPPPDAEESAMLEGALERRIESRLACRITLTEAHDGLRVGVPSSQV